MQTPALAQCLATYQQWKTRVSRAVLDLERWLDTQDRATSATRAQVAATLDAIEQDRLEVAFVAERSRGKSELINAMVFADLGGRLLPTTTGRATVCPTEILWDVQRKEPYLRLLPIETRARDTSLAALKVDPKQWVHYPLDPKSPEQMAATLKELMRTKWVPAAEATRLGLADPGGASEDPSPSDPSPFEPPPSDLVEIPRWRYAVVSFPHPLLKQGLVLLDTPGVGVLRGEPEIAATLLPAVATVVFVVGANSGVSSGDLEIWQQQLGRGNGGSQRTPLVVLNKVDALWGGVTERRAIDAAIGDQRRVVAGLLGIADESVLPVSGHKGLVAKVRRDDGLLRRSGLPALERQLARRLLESKQQSLAEMIGATTGRLVEEHRQRIAVRISRLKADLDELEDLRDKSEEVINQLLERTRREQERYLRGVQQFQRAREALLDECRHSREILERENIDELIETARLALAASWTTRGLHKGMRSLFEDLRRVIQTVASESERIRKLVRETYALFRDDFELEVATPKVFTPMNYRVEIELLFQEVESFRASPATALSARGAVIRRFEQQLVSRVEVLFDQLRESFDGWIRDTLQPLAEEIQGHKATMEQRLENLQRVARSKDALQQRVDVIQGQYVTLAEDLTALRNIHNALHYDPLAEGQDPPRPRLVAGQ
jgi:hypothetical protein